MKTLQEIKGIVAKENGFESWVQVQKMCIHDDQLESMMDIVCRSYAEQYKEANGYSRGWHDATDAAVAAVKKNYEPTTPTAG